MTRFQELLDELAAACKVLCGDHTLFAEGDIHSKAEELSTDCKSQPLTCNYALFEEILAKIALEYQALRDENLRLGSDVPLSDGGTSSKKLCVDLAPLSYHEKLRLCPEDEVADEQPPAHPNPTFKRGLSDGTRTSGHSIHHAIDRVDQGRNSIDISNDIPSIDRGSVTRSRKAQTSVHYSGDVEGHERRSRQSATFKRSHTQMTIITSQAETVTDMLSSAGADAEQETVVANLRSTITNILTGRNSSSASDKTSDWCWLISFHCLVWLLALAGVVFVLWAHSAKFALCINCAATEDKQHRRLAGGASKMLKHIAFAMTGAGLMALVINMLKQPLLLGYLLGGVLVGPAIGLGLLDSHESMSDISSLGLILLLFMIGLELNLVELLKMGKLVLAVGALQFPTCAGVMFAVLTAFYSLGLSFGEGDYSTLYCGVTCGISSTMIVVKLLSEKGDMDSKAGRLTIGILIFQDIWAIIVLALQPTISNPDVFSILETFTWICLLLCVALAYAKFVMPVVFIHAAKNVELMLITALSWCFFIGCFATLMGLSMELAALVAGVALAAFPYSAEFNGKIKYIRDFFVTLFFVALGMQIPIPTFEVVSKSICIVCVTVLLRWVGIFCIVCLMGGGTRLAILSTLNLSQISELALAICKLGYDLGHIDGETMAIIIWTFVLLALASGYVITFNHVIYKFITRKGNAMRRNDSPILDDGEERSLVFLGFHRVAFDLFSEFQRNFPQILKKVHLIDVDASIMPMLRDKGIKCSYGDISSPDVLEHIHHGGESDIIISTIPDSCLLGVTNMRILQVAQQVWPAARYIVTADSAIQAKQLYGEGAHYVLKMAKLCADRLHDLLSESVFNQAPIAGELCDAFELYRSKDCDRRLSESA